MPVWAQAAVPILTAIISAILSWYLTERSHKRRQRNEERRREQEEQETRLERARQEEDQWRLSTYETVVLEVLDSNRTCMFVRVSGKHPYIQLADHPFLQPEQTRREYLDAIERLQDRGFVEPTVPGGQVFKITYQGREALKRLPERKPVMEWQKGMTEDDARELIGSTIQFWLTERDYGDIVPGPQNKHTARIDAVEGTDEKAEIVVNPKFPLKEGKEGPDMRSIPVAWIGEYRVIPL